MSVFLSYHFSMQPCSVVFSVPFLQYYSNLKHGLVNVCSASIETAKSFPFGKETEREMKERGKNEETCFLADSCAIFPDSVRFFLTHQSSHNGRSRQTAGCWGSPAVLWPCPHLFHSTLTRLPLYQDQKWQRTQCARQGGLTALMYK